MEKHKKFKYFSKKKLEYERKDSLQSKYLSRVKNDALDWSDMPILRKRSKTNGKIKQQQTLITSKIYVRFKKQI